MKKTIIALLAVLTLVVAACGDDDTTETTGAGSTTEATAATTTEAPAIAGDFNGDGVVRFAVATDGPRDDGAYYQALVDKVEEISAANGFEDPIIVDMIDPANADAELAALAQQGVDLIAVGSSAIAEGLPALAQEYSDIFWYCNCGSGSPATEGILKSEDRGAELWISGGYAAGLLLQERGGDSATFIGCCDLNFEVESFNAFVYGLQLVDPSFTATYVPTGNFPFDFNNTAGATEAFNAALAEGTDVVVPFLGEAHQPIVRLANENNLIVMTAGQSDGCENPDLHYDFEVKFSAGDYVQPVFDDILAGVAQEGGIREFHVGIDPEVGAEFCDGATAEQVAMLNDLNARIGAGDFADDIYAIVADAYGF